MITLWGFYSFYWWHICFRFTLRLAFSLFQLFFFLFLLRTKGVYCYWLKAVPDQNCNDTALNVFPVCYHRFVQIVNRSCATSLLLINRAWDPSGKCICPWSFCVDLNVLNSSSQDLSLALFSQYGPHAWLITKDIYCISCDNL